MPTEFVFVIGSGGHAKVVLDALSCQKSEPEELLVIDEDATRVGTRVLNVPVASWPVHAALAGACFHVAIGSGDARRRLHLAMTEAGGNPLSIAHPHASIAASAAMEAGCFVAARSVVGPDARLAPGVIVNHGAVVDHDCAVGRFSHIAPNATLGGGVTIGASVLVGAGATVLPGISIGDGAIIGAGATIARHVDAGDTVYFALVRKRKGV